MVNPKATTYQIKIGAQLGLDVSGDKIAVAAAKIGDIVGQALDPTDTVHRPGGEAIAQARSLGIDISHDTVRVAFAKIEDAGRLKTFETLAKLGVKPGDKVGIRRSAFVGGRIEQEVQEWVISWISREGEVFFKRANGRSAWPQQLVKVPSERGS
jgi:hypothetical protein